MLGNPERIQTSMVVNTVNNIPKQINYINGRHDIQLVLSYLEGDPRNFYDGRSISHLLRNNLLRVLKSATREPVVVVKFPVVYPS